MCDAFTVLTQDPTETRARQWWRRLRALRPAQPGGASVVQTNLLQGLREIGQPFRWNPHPARVTPHVGVLTNVRALRWAIAAKRAGTITRLVAGPNLVVTPLDEARILCAPEIDRVLTPSRWVSDFYRALVPELAGKLAEWPIGVDPAYWSPAEPRVPRDDFLVYQKLEPHDAALAERVAAELERQHLRYRRVIYGAYTPHAYRAALRSCRALIFLSASESQGIALFEAWACDVPVLAWDRGTRVIANHTVACSSAPYLTPATGTTFNDTDDLGRAIETFCQRTPQFSPRASILAQFTLAHSARAYARELRGATPHE